MYKITTQNSTYTIEAKDYVFEVIKIAESVPNPNGIHIGWKYHCEDIRLLLSGVGKFGNFYTSLVISIEMLPTTKLS